MLFDGSDTFRKMDHYGYGEIGEDKANVLPQFTDYVSNRTNWCDSTNVDCLISFEVIILARMTQTSKTFVCGAYTKNYFLIP